ncbi:putative glycosyl hydrolase [Actinoplanes missouriensis 431]|uniref:Putative glycosyl hydrolase n=1 Tax=Actinoplanes missouriensis (strain ATCC 14538 / DSM 43046 / CBS 188.64 / JCM 3121 / NBRC 102363 / NCIMB 12654 / NRRL B-3342 / UNCC 431) TaxID=512565 RepID=I0H8F1_ACTM4|nr:putative glycosyl hydrolase [Actinoplanes missouriensis 431]
MFLSVLVAGSPAQAAPDDGLLLHYRLDETSGTVAADASGNHRDGAVLGTPAWDGAQGLGFNGTNTYVRMPDSVLRDRAAISVAFDVRIDPAQATPYFLYGFGNTDAGTGYGNGYLFATGNTLRTSISLSNWAGEQNIRPADGRALARGAWKHLTYTQAGTTGTLYEDGVAVATNTAISILPSAIGGGTTTANYIGRSLYTSDRYFAGRMRDFRVYDRALTADEARALAAPANTEAVAADTAALDLGDTAGVIADLTLPSTAAGGSAITWSTSDPGLVTATGKVTRPARGSPDGRATLTATLRRGEAAGSKTFPITVRAEYGDRETAEAAAAALTVTNLDDVRGNLTLPVAGSSGSTVSWSSASPSVISSSGVVHRSAASDETVVLTAHVTSGSVTVNREFSAFVPRLPAAAPYEGYLFSYFTGEGYANGEQVYNALSNGNDPLSWREINNGQPVLTSTLGTQGLRDPFIIRSPEGDKFYQIATDLKIYGNGDWDASQRTGSKSIMVWESTDLVNWTDQRLVRVSPDTAGNTWAPEAFYSEPLGAYVVFWASKLYAESDTAHTGSSYNRMMYATTRDFHTFSEPKVWKDPGYSVIDSTVIEHDGVYHRITKDERNNSSSSPCSKFLIQEKSTDLLSRDYSFVAECIGSGALSRGEGPLIFKSNTPSPDGKDKWYLFIDEYGGRGYVPFSTTDLDSGVWTPETKYSLPSRPRHGTVLPVTKAEYDRLSARWEEPAPARGLRLRYEFDETTGTVAKDSSGNGFDGVYHRTPAWGAGVSGRSFAMAGGSDSPYVTIPNGVLRQASAATVSTWVKWPSSTTVNQWIYGLGPDSTKYLFSSPRNGSNVLYSAITGGSWSAESKLPSAAPLPGGSWQHLAVTVDGGTAAMYLNGVRIASAGGVTIKPSDLYDPAKTYSGYVGRSLYAGDPYFAGEVDDFRIYNTALSAGEILALAGKGTSVGAVSLAQLKVDAIIDDAAAVIKLPVAEGTGVTALAPKFTLAAGSTITPASGIARDFTKPVTYRISSPDGSERDWTVRALVMKSPVLPGLYADPNISVVGDTFWIHPTTDGYDGWSGTRIHAFSSKDLVHWTDHGVALDLGPDVTWADNSAWAPAFAQRDGKYYLYFSGGMATGNTAKHLGVAVADSPAGPFTDALGKPLVAAGTYSGQMIDPAVFTDDDGSSYLYWGNGSSYQVKLKNDMTSFESSQVKTYRPVNYNEGSFVVKRNGTYYFMWSENDTRSADYRIAYATGTSPLGPWNDRVGVILQKDPALGILGTGHHSVVQLPNSDDWYIAYHRFKIPGGDGTHREATIDRLTFAPDGSINPVTPTLESVNPVTVASAGPDTAGIEGAKIALSGTVSNTANRPAWTVNTTSCTVANQHDPSTTVTCVDDGVYELTLTAGASHDTTIVTVGNAAPVITAPGGRPAPVAPIATGTTVTRRLPVSDPGAGDALTCTASFGDGSQTTGTVAGGVCTISHAYPAAGVYRPQVTVTDDDGATATVSLPHVVTYVAGSGQVAGGGRLRNGPDFAFVAKGGAYGGGTWLRLPDGRVFEATRQGPAVVLGTSALYTGVGTLDGAGRHPFAVAVTGRILTVTVAGKTWSGPAAGGGLVVSPRIRGHHGVLDVEVMAGRPHLADAPRPPFHPAGLPGPGAAERIATPVPSEVVLICSERDRAAGSDPSARRRRSARTAAR